MEPQGSFLIDIGLETACVAVISLGDIVLYKSIGVGAEYRGPALYSAILECVREVLSCTPPELCADIYDHGMCIAGGGAFTKGIAEYLTLKTGLHAYVAHPYKGQAI